MQRRYQRGLPICWIQHTEVEGSLWAQSGSWTSLMPLIQPVGPEELDLELKIIDSLGQCRFVQCPRQQSLDF